MNHQSLGPLLQRLVQKFFSYRLAAPAFWRPGALAPVAPPKAGPAEVHRTREYHSTDTLQ
jgi:hypothetical protein